MLRRLGLTAVFSLGLLLPAAAASAQSANYPGGNEGDVLSENVERPAPVESGAVEAVTASRSSGLAVTGTDVAQLGGLGVVLIGGGTVLVRRSRRRTAPATA
jgi:hypothetical protein